MGPPAALATAHVGPPSPISCASGSDLGSVQSTPSAGTSEIMKSLQEMLAPLSANVAGLGKQLNDGVREINVQI